MAQSHRRRPVAVWLFVMSALVALMVIVGGATRLTDSGLSIVEWRPVTGAVPPLSQAHWQDEFDKYKTIPEYEEVNWGMSLDEFKRIYWWEWGHRFLGRVIGFAFLIPLIFFIATRRVDRALAARLGVLFILGGLQGALGWWMVSSGLSARVDVSQYRLAAHLALALLLFAALLWTAFDTISAPRAARSSLAPFAFALAGGVYLQMILGAFVAGLRAGRTFNTWPLMDGKLFPDGYFSAAPGFHDLFETAAASQFNHRLGAYILAAAVGAFFLAARNSDIAGRARLLAFAIAAQIALGVWTVLAATPISLGLAHQAGALIVFALALFAAHGSIRSILMTGASSSAA
ncbi:MAG: COX15/CtaA family protein [Parvularculaceae bacterium]|nr:COX15/CtaA family protein [Parvularculaceae bacterium]